MAKVKVLFGQMRGKIGGTVFRHDPDGFTVASEYNPQPANPRTLLQVRQRNKMNLAGRLSKMTPATVIAGLSSNPRKARSLFVSMLLKSTTASSGDTPNSVRAQVDPSALEFSKGIFIPLTVSKTYTQGTRTVAVSISKDPSGITMLGARVIIYVSKDGVLDYCDFKDVSGNAEDTPLSASFVIPTTEIGEEEGQAYVYIIPFYDNGTDASVRFAQQILENSGAWSILAVRDMIAAQAVGHSEYEGGVSLIS